MLAFMYMYAHARLLSKPHLGSAQSFSCLLL